MADSWQKYLYQQHAALAVNPLKSEPSVRLLDVLVKMRRRGSSPILCNIGSMFKLGSKESEETAYRLREGLKRFESNTDCDEGDEELFLLNRAQPDIKHTVESRAAVKSSLLIFGDAANLDIDGDKRLECQLQRVQIASVDRAALEEIICQQEWTPDVPKLTKLKYWSERSRFKFFGKSMQDLWVIYEILQAKKVILKSVDSLAGAVGGPPVGANLRMSATKKTLVEDTAPDNKVMAFGFRVIHARYDSTGEFVSFAHVHEWSALPTVWGKQESENIDLGSMFVKLGTPETLSGELQTRGSRIEKLGTHYMPWNTATVGTNFLECQHESGPQISFCWRVGDEDSTLELVFRSAESMSRVVGLGLEFAKVVVSTSTWEVKIIGIGQESWEVMWTELTGLDKNHKVGGILSVKMMGGGLQDDLAKEYLGGIESAQKYGVGLPFANNRAYVQFTNVLHERDHCLVLHKIVEYLMLEKVDLAKIGNQCAVSGEAGSSSRGANNSDQVNNDGTWIRQTLSNFRDWLSKGESKSNGDNEDNRSPSNKEPPKVEDESASKNTCKITVRPRAGGSFMDEAGGQFFLEAPFRPLNGASIDPTLVFVFDKNGSFGKQILVTTTTSFDLGKSAPARESNGSFGWYHNLLLTSLRNVPRQAVLETTLCKLLMENPKDTKSSVKQIDTHSSASTSEKSIAGQVGIHGTHIGGHSTGTETGGKTSAREAASENPSSLDMWRGFIYRDLSAPAESSACYDFDCSLQSPTLEVLKDRKTRSTYMGSGMCGAVRPTFVGAWSIVPDDTTEASKYAFEAERTLKHLYKIGEEEKEHKTIQKYDVEILVNHAMTHLCNVKGDHVLRENDSVLNVMTVSKRRERKWLQYPF